MVSTAWSNYSSDVLVIQSHIRALGAQNTGFPRGLVVICGEMRARERGEGGRQNGDLGAGRRKGRKGNNNRNKQVESRKEGPPSHSRSRRQGRAVKSSLPIVLIYALLLF